MELAFLWVTCGRDAAGGSAIGRAAYALILVHGRGTPEDGADRSRTGRRWHQRWAIIERTGAG